MLVSRKLQNPLPAFLVMVNKMKNYLASKVHIFALISSAVFGFGLGVNSLKLGAICFVIAIVLDYISFKNRVGGCAVCEKS